MSKAIEKIEVESSQANQDSMVAILNDLMSMDREIGSVLAILRKVTESGILEALAALIERNQEVMSVIFGELSQKENSNFVRNILTVYTLLSRIDPEKLRKFMKNLAESINESDKFRGERPLGLLSIGREIKDPDISTGIRVLLNAARGFSTKDDAK